MSWCVHSQCDASVLGLPQSPIFVVTMMPFEFIHELIFYSMWYFVLGAVIFSQCDISGSTDLCGGNYTIWLDMLFSMWHFVLRAHWSWWWQCVEQELLFSSSAISARWFSSSIIYYPLTKKSYKDQLLEVETIELMTLLSMLFNVRCKMLHNVHCTYMSCNVSGLLLPVLL